MILKQNLETGYWTEMEGAHLVNVHDPNLCDDRGCAIHNHPSNHPLSTAPLNWREDAGKLERICKHGIGHNDYDAVEYQLSIGADRKYTGIHGCDGCCSGMTY